MSLRHNNANDLIKITQKKGELLLPFKQVLSGLSHSITTRGSLRSILQQAEY